mgnify:CR=1 FL=1
MALLPCTSILPSKRFLFGVQLMKGVTIFFSLLLIWATHSRAEELANIDHLFSLSLQQLLAIKVSVASSAPERIIETPAIVSRYEAADMAAMGLKTLKELLSFIPGVVLQDTRGGSTAVIIRGLVDGSNQKVLFLLDGVPYWMPDTSEIPLLGIPIESISHVEVIRGPGAVYYGSNASGGVINVVTQKAAGNVAALNVGSNNLRNGSGYFHTDINPQSSASFAFETQREDGYNGEFKGVPRSPLLPDTESNDGAITRSEEMTSFLGRYTYQNFNLLAQTYRSIRDESDKPTPLFLGVDVEYIGHLVHADYTWQLNDAHVFLYSDYNQFYTDLVIKNLALGVDVEFRYGDHGEDNTRWRSGATLNYTVNDSLSLFGGIEYERREIENLNAFGFGPEVLIFRQADSNIERSAFGQADVKTGPWRFLLGARYTDNSESGDKLTPRASTVYKIDHAQSLKLLYSVGFNSPNFQQSSISAIEGLTGNPDLKPEVVKTFELGYSYEADNNLFVVNAYYLEAEDFIQRQFDPATKAIIYFLEAFDRYGLELDFQHAHLKYVYFANGTYNHQGDSLISGDTSANFVPNVTASLGGLYHFNNQHSGGASLRATGGRNRADALYQLNLNYQYKYQQFELSTTVRNVLDEDIITPDVADFSDDHLIPSGDGINILVVGKYYF